MVILPYSPSETGHLNRQQQGGHFLLPAATKASFGYCLRQLQQGGTPLGLKALTQFGTGVFELRDSFNRNAYRLLYVANLRKSVYVLHAFRKKATSGIKLPK